jgi:hypothetical protein
VKYRPFVISKSRKPSAALAAVAALQPATDQSAANAATAAEPFPASEGAGSRNAANAASAAAAPADFEETAAVLEYDGALPRPWAEAFARFQCEPRPDVPEGLCHQAIDDAGRLLDDHRQALDRFSWRPPDLFGENGIAWRLCGSDSLEVTADAIVLVDGRRLLKPEQARRAG